MSDESAWAINEIAGIKKQNGRKENKVVAQFFVFSAITSF